MPESKNTIPKTSLPIALQWVARELDEHPHIRSISYLKPLEDAHKVHVVATFVTELPSRWKSESPSGVRREESVIIEFDNDYPRNAPEFYLRKDFNRSHPHLWPTDENSYPQPCLVYANSREFIQASGGITRLIDQLVLWLERASEANLIDPLHGWEPTRRDRLTSVLVADIQKFNELITTRGGCKFFRSSVQWQMNNCDESFWCYANAFEEKQLPNKKIEHIVEFATNNSINSVSTLTIFSWPGKNIDGSLRIDAQYTPEFVNSMETLFQRAKQFGCHIDLKIKVRKLRQLIARYRIHKPVPFIFIITARRPCNLEGTNSNYEFCPYLVLITEDSDLLEDSKTSVMPLGHRNTVSPALLKQTSMHNAHEFSRDWIGVGCGSVGSKLAMHLARSGMGPSAVVDYDLLEPHNYARHSALPINSTTGQMFYRTKSAQLANDLSTLGQEVVDHHIDIVQSLIDDKDNSIFENKVDQVVVNSTGSLVVRESLACANWKNMGIPSPLLVECCLMGAGSIGYFATEGTNNNPNLADLSTTFYQSLQHDSKLSDSVFQTAPEQINIGQGCGTQSFIISDSTISQHTASFAQSLDQLLLNPKGSDKGQIRYQVIADDKLSISSKTIDVDPFEIVTNENSNVPETRIARSVANKIDSTIAAFPGVETGGILVGRYSSIGNSFHVVDLVDAPDDSEFKSDLFVLGKNDLSEILEKLALKSYGTLYALGTWHNHLGPSGPSAIDQNSAQKMSQSQQIPLLMLIRTPENFITLSPPPFSSDYSE